MFGLDAGALDRHITGNYGEDQYEDADMDLDAPEEDFDRDVWDRGEWITQEEEAFRIAVREED